MTQNSSQQWTGDGQHPLAPSDRGGTEQKVPLEKGDKGGLKPQGKDNFQLTSTGNPPNPPWQGGLKKEALKMAEFVYFSKNLAELNLLLGEVENLKFQAQTNQALQNLIQQETGQQKIIKFLAFKIQAALETLPEEKQAEVRNTVMAITLKADWQAEFKINPTIQIITQVVLREKVETTPQKAVLSEFIYNTLKEQGEDYVFAEDEVGEMVKLIGRVTGAIEFDETVSADNLAAVLGQQAEVAAEQGVRTADAYQKIKSALQLLQEVQMVKTCLEAAEAVRYYENLWRMKQYQRSITGTKQVALQLGGAEKLPQTAETRGEEKEWVEQKTAEGWAEGKTQEEEMASRQAMFNKLAADQEREEMEKIKEQKKQEEEEEEAAASSGSKGGWIAGLATGGAVGGTVAGIGAWELFQRYFG